MSQQAANLKKAPKLRPFHSTGGYAWPFPYSLYSTGGIDRFNNLPNGIQHKIQIQRASNALARTPLARAQAATEDMLSTMQENTSQRAFVNMMTSSLARHNLYPGLRARAGNKAEWLVYHTMEVVLMGTKNHPDDIRTSRRVRWLVWKNMNEREFELPTPRDIACLKALAELVEIESRPFAERKSMWKHIMLLFNRFTREELVELKIPGRTARTPAFPEWWRQYIPENDRESLWTDF